LYIKIKREYYDFWENHPDGIITFGELEKQPKI